MFSRSMSRGRERRRGSKPAPESSGMYHPERPRCFQLDLRESPTRGYCYLVDDLALDWPLLPYADSTMSVSTYRRYCQLAVVPRGAHHALRKLNTRGTQRGIQGLHKRPQMGRMNVLTTFNDIANRASPNLVSMSSTGFSLVTFPCQVIHL